VPLEIVDGGDVRARIAVPAGEPATFLLERVEHGDTPLPYPDADIAAEPQTSFPTSVGISLRLQAFCKHRASATVRPTAPCAPVRALSLETETASAGPPNRMLTARS